MGSASVATMKGVSEEKLGIVYEHEWGAKCTQVVVMISSFIECTESHDEI